MSFTPASDLFGLWRAGLFSGTPPTLYPGGDAALTRVEIGPGLVSLFGGPPGVGKSAFTMQLVIDALRLSPKVKALVANVEMSPAALFDRQLARLCGIDLRVIRHRKLPADHGERIEVGVSTLASVLHRLAFVRPAWTVENVIQGVIGFGASLLLLDYAQRFTPPGIHAHRKSAVDAVMEHLRRIADDGVAVVVVAAVGRQKDQQGRGGYGGLNLASFRESSELEYGADDPFLLVRAASDDPAAVTLRHVKSRHGETLDLPHWFTGSLQRFEPASDWSDGTATADAVRNAWGPADTEGSNW